VEDIIKQSPARLAANPLATAVSGTLFAEYDPDIPVADLTTDPTTIFCAAIIIWLAVDAK
jgi:hypothetical protein